MFSLAVPDGEPAESFPVTRSRPGLVRIWVGPAPFAPGSWPDLFWEPACSATGLLLNFIQGLTAWYFAYCSAPAYLRSFSRASLSHGPFATRPYSRFRSEEHTSELQSRGHLVCRLLLAKKKRQSE